MSDGHNLEAHVFICTNNRETGQSCAGSGSVEMREAVKKACQDPSRNWHGRVRVNTSGCLGRCKDGITAVVYPKAEWLTHLTKDGGAAKVEAVISSILDR